MTAGLELQLVYDVDPENWNRRAGLGVADSKEFARLAHDIEQEFPGIDTGRSGPVGHPNEPKMIVLVRFNEGEVPVGAIEMAEREIRDIVDLTPDERFIQTY